MPLQTGSNIHVPGNPEMGGGRFFDQRSAISRPSGIYTTSMPQLNREFKERPDAIQRGGQQASGPYHKSIRDDDVRHSNFDPVAQETFTTRFQRHQQEQGGQDVGITSPRKPYQDYLQNPEMERNGFFEQRSGINRPSGRYTTSMPHLDREFKERADAIQRGGQQASGYYHKSIRNDDVRRTGLGMVTEENFTSSQNNTHSQSYPQEQGMSEAAHLQKQWHPIQRGKTQASGSFHRTIENDDVNRSDPMTSAHLHRPPQNDRPPESSQQLYNNDRILQNEGEPDLGQTRKNNYWSSNQDDDDMQVSRHGHQGPTTTLSVADQLGKTKTFGRVFEWEPATEGHSNGPVLSQERQEREARQSLHPNQNPEVLLQPRTLLPRPALSPLGQNANVNLSPLGQHDNVNLSPLGQHDNVNDHFYANQANPHDVAEANPSHNHFNSTAIESRPQTEAAGPEQTLSSAPPAPFIHDRPSQFKPFTTDDPLKKDRKMIANFILVGVVVLCFLLVGTVVVILVEVV